MELRQLRHFMAVVTHGGFTAAARAELIVQSALSTSVRNLERELGAELFDRTGRRVVLTEAGRALLPSARSVLAGTEAAREAVAAVAGLVTGRVRVGTIQTLTCVDLAAELAAYHRPGCRSRCARRRRRSWSRDCGPVSWISPTSRRTPPNCPTASSGSRPGTRTWC
ncbi:LysR family transcriptional regulator [Streptomyces sp. NBC_01591]|nr:LysR family transcriptional regulator [Streptomyces sp. NBC_01591]